jgi:hypothetical protein
VQSGSTELTVAPAVNTDRGLLLAGALAPAIFLSAMVLGMFISSEGPRTHGSDLALGPFGWLMSIVFIVVGAGFAAFGVGLYRALDRGSRVGMVLLVIAGLGIIGAGVFVTDAPGARETTHGNIHNMLFMVTMIALLLNLPFNGLKLRNRGWRHGFGIYTIASAVALPILLGIFLTIGSAPGDPLYGISGVLELALIGVPFAWVEVVALRLSRRTG